MEKDKNYEKLFGTFNKSEGLNGKWTEININIEYRGPKLFGKIVVGVFYPINLRAF